jgi:hypothetical protein
MSRAVIVRYTTRTDLAAENQRLVEKVFTELAADDPGGLRYAAFRLADGVSFVHIAIVEGQDNPLTRSEAFAEFSRHNETARLEPPTRTEATLLGSYRLMP